MNTSTISKTAVTNTSHVADAATDKPVLDREQGTLSLPPAPVGSEDITVVRVPANKPKVPPPRNKPSIAVLTTPVIRIQHLLAGVMLVGMVGCGTTSGDRVVSGAGIGAGAGAVLGAVTGMGPGTGAAIGAAAGAATGGLTKKKQINLGKPIWR